MCVFVRSIFSHHIYHDAHGTRPSVYLFASHNTFSSQDYDTLQWIAQKVDGGYADATMDIVIMEADEDTDEELERMLCMCN